MKQKLFTLLTALLFLSSGAWADVTPSLPSGTLTLPTVPSTGWTGDVTPTYYNPDGTSLYVFYSVELYKSSQTWKSNGTTGTSGSVSIAASSPFPASSVFTGFNKGAAVKVGDKGPYAYRVTNCVAAYALVASGSDKKRTVQIEVFEVVTGEVAAVATGTDETESSALTTIKVTGLDSSKEYYVRVSQKSGSGSGGSSSGNSTFYMVAFEAPSTPQSPTFSPASGIVEQGGTVSVTSTNAENIYYAWTSTESEPATPASWSYVTATAGVGSVPVPGEVTGTYYLYAYGKNSESGTIAHATYTISTPRTATTLAFVTPTTTVGVDNTVTNTPTLTPAAANEGAAFTYVSSDTDVATVDENTGEVTGVAVGTARITATYAGDATYSGSTGYYDIEVVQSAVDTKFWTSGALYSAKGGSGTYSFTGSEFIDNLEIVGSATALTITSGGNKTIDGNTVGGRVRFNKAGTEGGNYLHFKVKPNTKITFWGVRAGDTSMENGLALSIGSFGENEKVYSFEAGDVESMTYYYTGTSNTDVYAYSKADAGASMMAIKVETVTTEEITPSYDKTTYVTTEKLDFTDVIGLKAYAATAASASGITMSPVGAVPASTPLMLIGTASTTYNVPIVASADAPATNYLRAGTGAENWASIGGANYILYSDGKFHPVTSGTVATTKAYLHLDAAPSSHVLDIIFDEAGETTGIASVGKPQTTTEREVYNLAGQRVAQPTKGLYIVNGKKMVIK